MFCFWKHFSFYNEDYSILHYSKYKCVFINFLVNLNYIHQSIYSCNYDFCIS